jgi:hypothetical protein
MHPESAAIACKAMIDAIRNLVVRMMDSPYLNEARAAWTYSYPQLRRLNKTIKLNGALIVVHGRLIIQ